MKNSSEVEPQAELCRNCLKPLTNHRPWCKDITTSPPPKVGDVVEHPLLGPTPLISVVTREELFEDGVLVDCTEEPFDELNGNAGIRFDVSMTTTAFHRYVEIPEKFNGSQDLKGRYWDIVWMFRFAARSKTTETELIFEFHCIPNGDGFEPNERRSEVGSDHRLVQLKAVLGFGDRGEPCLTFSLPNED